MANYRRSKRLKRCQRWDFDGQVWTDCPFDEPETRERGPREGMIVAPMADPNEEGPLVIPIADLIAALRNKR